MTGLWARLPLAGRLGLALGSLYLAGMLVLLSRLLANDVETHAAALHQAGRREIELTMALVSEHAVLGDYATIEQMLQRVLEEEAVTVARWVDGSGREVGGEAEAEGSALLHRWLNLPEVVERRELMVGGRSYGAVLLCLSPLQAEREIFARLLTYVGIMVVNGLLLTLAMVMVLRRALAPLRDLDGVAQQIRAGESPPPLQPRGAPELRHLTIAFNAMNEAREVHRQELERFTDIMAHHLQEPVRLQYAFAQRLASQLPQPLPEGPAVSLSYVLKGATRLRSLINDVQIYLALRQLRPAAAPCAAGPVVDRVLGMLHGRLAECGAQVLVAPGLPRVWIAQDRLSDLFRALFDNAIEYRHPDRPLRIVVAVRLEPETETVVLTVTDNGIGIPAEYREKVFRVFERLHSNENHPGTGIGLALVRRIAEMEGGRVWVEDGDGSGCRLCVRLRREETMS